MRYSTSALLGHRRTARRPCGEDAALRRLPAGDCRRAPQGFPAIGNQGEYHNRGRSAIKRAASGDGFGVKVAWEKLEETESTWEPVSRVFHDERAVLRKGLKALRQKAEQKRALVQRYGLRL